GNGHSKLGVYMSAIQITPLRDDLPFGVRIEGVTSEALKDEAARAEILEAFEKRGLIHFAGVEPSNHLQVEVSRIFGPLKEHPVHAVDRVDPEALPGVIEIKSDPSN